MVWEYTARAIPCSRLHASRPRAADALRPASRHRRGKRALAYRRSAVYFADGPWTRAAALKPVDVNNWITQLADDRAVVFSERQWVTFSVRDTGPGISFEDMPHIFERFSTEAGPRPGGA